MIETQGYILRGEQSTHILAFSFPNSCILAFRNSLFQNVMSAIPRRDSIFRGGGGGGQIPKILQNVLFFIISFVVSFCLGGLAP